MITDIKLTFDAIKDIMIKIMPMSDKEKGFGNMKKVLLFLVSALLKEYACMPP